MAEVIKEKDTLKSYQDNMIIYSIVVNRRRMIPEVKDSLKPVQRRIIYDMMTLSPLSYVKSARITGDTMGKYHPHGPTSIYGAMVTMANSINCKMPLIDGSGNWGTVMGDGAAAERYTEARLTPFAYEFVLGELKATENAVDWSKTYDDKNKEPDYLPVEVPLLLINGSYGIGVGMVNEIPSHNMIEVIDVTRKLIRDPNADFVLVPDQCMPCNIIDTDWREINETGCGNYKVRGIVEIGEHKGYPALFIKSLPERIYTNTITSKLNDMVVKKELPMIKDIIDPSKTNAVNIIIQLKKGADPNFVKEIIYKKTEVEKTFTVNFEVVDGIEPKRFTYREYILAFLRQRKITKFRVYCSKMQTLMTRLHKIQTYIQVLESGEIDNIIDMIKKRKDTDDEPIIEYIIKKVGITDIQAKFIITTDLRKLSLGYLRKYKEEQKELTLEKARLEDYITDEKNIEREIDEELAQASKKYGKPRICKVIKAQDDSNIPKGVFKIVVTDNNYIRKLSLEDKAVNVKGDGPKFVLKVDNQESVLLFDNKGKVFKLPVHKIPLTERGGSGIDIRMAIRGLTANIAAVIYDPTVREVAKIKGTKHFITVVTANNYIKKLDIEDFINVPLSGMIYTKLSSSEDEVVDVQISPDNLDIIIYSGHKALRVPMKEIPNYKRASQGVLAMNTNENISGISLVYPNATHVVVVTKAGKINKLAIAALERTTRNKAGSSVIKLAKTDSILSLFGVNDSNGLTLITRSGRQIIPVKDIEVMSSASAGVKNLSFKGDNSIIKASITMM